MISAISGAPRNHGLRCPFGMCSFSNAPGAHTGHALCGLPDSLLTIRWRGVAPNPVHGTIHPLCLRSCAAHKPRLSIRDCSFEGLSPSSELFLAFSSASASPAPETEDESDVGFMARTGWYK